jgi:hypothetical protein
MFRDEEASFSYREFVFIRGIRRNATFRMRYFVAFLQPNSQFVLHGHEIVSLIFSALCQVQANNYLPLSPPPNPPPPLLLHHLLPFSSCPTSFLLLLKGAFTPKHRLNLG